ncbi:hypothetical protein CIHG_01853 [Coccidioides immitis H538.4]|uniref:Uncharacterized protein n=2 Tax=Coccidioides immitis TaxID=5501 RepID=A0A0J8RGM8_COCIT|nr:hypothetical protein CIRG_06173 [Coccidioides immitis RMSCC 2394]KMU84067.1 hypothetical protein CIHG_01853 [Coccidioides immitis H538.4]
MAKPAAPLAELAQRPPGSKSSSVCQLACFSPIGHGEERRLAFLKPWNCWKTFRLNSGGLADERGTKRSTSKQLKLEIRIGSVIGNFTVEEAKTPRRLTVRAELSSDITITIGVVGQDAGYQRLWTKLRCSAKVSWLLILVGSS